jgi:hypothetical protein
LERLKEVVGLRLIRNCNTLIGVELTGKMWSKLHFENVCVCGEGGVEFSNPTYYDKAWLKLLNVVKNNL